MDDEVTMMTDAIAVSSTMGNSTSSDEVGLPPPPYRVQIPSLQAYIMADDTDDIAVPTSSGPGTSTYRPSIVEWAQFREFFSPERHQLDNSHNLDSHQFLSTWSHWLERQESKHDPNQHTSMPPLGIYRGTQNNPTGILSAHHLEAETCNFQGLDWKNLGTTSASIREARRKTYVHKTNKMDHIYGIPPINNLEGPSTVRQYMDSVGMDWAKEIPGYDNHFKFRQMFLERRPHLAHFQLRNMISAISRNAVFYANERGIYRLDTRSGKKHCIMCLKRWPRPSLLRGTITTLIASHDVLIAGGWEGQYAMKSLLSENDDTYTEGSLSCAHDASINHISVFPNRRSGIAQAAISSNDCHIRIVDCYSNTLVQAHKLPSAVNCSATSPDGRLRLVVADQTEPWILNADSGELIVRLPNHRDFGFACDWAPDGVHAATGNQDGIVQIWDSRNWSKPVQILSTELSGVRAMQFSPLGSGKRVLAMAEPADLVSIVDAETFKSKQRFEFLGEIGGLSFTPDGQRLYVANTDRFHGGIMEFERAGDGEKYGLARPSSENRDIWSVDSEILDDGLLIQSSRCRQQRTIGLEEVIV